MATDAEWRELRAALSDVAVRAAFGGYASDRFGAWQISVQRRTMGPWPPGDALLVVTLQHHQQRVQQWLAELPMTGTLS
jgi:hypothetical protein